MGGGGDHIAYTKKVVFVINSVQVYQQATNLFYFLFIKKIKAVDFSQLLIEDSLQHFQVLYS